MKFVENDGGRVDAGFEGKAGDCVVRAIAIAAEMDYSSLYRSLSEINKNSRSRMRCAGGLSARNGVDTRCVGFKRFMASIGWKFVPTMQIGSGCKVHLKADELPMGRLICVVSRHYVAVIDRVIHDNYDCSRRETRCVYGYWIKS